MSHVQVLSSQVDWELLEGRGCICASVPITPLSPELQWHRVIFTPLSMHHPAIHLSIHSTNIHCVQCERNGNQLDTYSQRGEWGEGGKGNAADQGHGRGSTGVLGVFPGMGYLSGLYRKNGD